MKKVYLGSLALAMSFSLFVNVSHAAEEEKITVSYDDWKFVQDIIEERKEKEADIVDDVLADDVDNKEEDLDEEILPISSREVENLTHEIIKGDQEIMTVKPDDGYFEGYEALNQNMSYEFAGVPVDIKAYSISFWQGEGEDKNLSKSIVVGLKDVAKALSGSKAKFNIVGSSGSSINLISGIDYKGSYNNAYSDSDLLNADISSFSGQIVIDGNAMDQSGFIIDGDYYFRASILAKALELRFFSDFEDSSKAYLEADKSDIKVPTEKEIVEEIDKAKYTIIYNRAPRCPYSRASLPRMEEFNDMLNKRNLDIQILGFINDSKNYTWKDLAVLFKDGKSPWVNFGANEEIYAFLEQLSGRKVTGFPNRYIIDKDGKVYGKEFLDYYDQIVEDMGLDEETMTEKDDELIQSYLYKNFADIALGEKLIKEAKKESKPVVEKEDEKEIPKVEKTATYIPKAASSSMLKPIEMVAKNPKTGISSILPVAITMLASIGGYKFTKKK